MKRLSTGGTGAVDRFLADLEKTPAPAAGRGRMMLAMDATASREASWDRATALHGEVFEEAGRSGQLDLQLCWYGGYREFHHSPWVTTAERLYPIMSGVRCAAGRTQVGRVLRHVHDEHARRAVGAVVLIGDAFEEHLDTVADRAGQLGVLGCRLFAFQEGNDPDCARAYRELARLTGGAYGRLDDSSASHLREWLRAVAAYATAGRAGLERLERSDRYRDAPRLSRQIRS